MRIAHGPQYVRLYCTSLSDFLQAKAGLEQMINFFLYAFFWVILRRLNFICRRFGTLCLFHSHRRIGVKFYTYPSMEMEQSVPKRQHMKFRRRRITQKKAYNIQNTAKV